MAGAGAAVTSTSASATTPLSSDFSLERGYAVQLGTLPSGATRSAANAAEKADRAKHATAVGLISQADFTVTPKPAAGDYVVYSGQYKSRAQAEQALAKLKHAFPAAVVIAVASVSAGPSQPGKALSTTSYGTYHSVLGLKPPSQAQLNQGASVSKRVASEINNNYVQSQKGLPNQISVP